MRLLLNTVVRNEADRYFQACLTHAQQFVDEMFVWDDDSTDQSAEIARSLGAVVRTRPADVPSFMEHEGLFREAGWFEMIDALQPETGDWIFILDADEFVIGDPRIACFDSEDLWGATSLFVRKHEIFMMNPFSVRVDGFWADINSPRLVRYDESADQSFRKKSMGTYIAPEYSKENQIVTHATELLHLGYATVADRKTKYERYRYLPGHNKNHINSIIQTPHLKMWEGPIPEIWRGMK